MSKISKIKRLVKIIARDPAMLNLVLERNDSYLKEAERLGFKDGLPVIDILDLFNNFNQSLDYFSSLDGGSLVTDMILLKNMVERYASASYFEIGTWRGESVVNVAPVAGKCYTLNLSSEDLRSLELSERYIGQQDWFSKNNPKIVHLKGNSLTFDFKPYRRKFDVVFIDGDHHYDSVKNDTRKAFDLIKDENSTIIWHDYGYSPEEIRYEVMCAIIDGTPGKYMKNLFHVSNTMCAIFTSKKYSVSFLKDKKEPSALFSLNIKAKKL